MAVQPDQTLADVPTGSQDDAKLAVDIVEATFPDETFLVGRKAIERLTSGESRLTDAGVQLEGADRFDYAATLALLKDGTQLVLALVGIYRTVLEIQKLRNESGSLAERIEKLALEKFPHLNPELRKKLGELVSSLLARLPKR